MLLLRLSTYANLCNHDAHGTKTPADLGQLRTAVVRAPVKIFAMSLSSVSRSPSGISWTLLCTVSFGALLSSMTASVIGVALPDIAREFQIDPSRAAWVVLGFLLTVTALLLLAGRLGDLFGPGRVYLTGFAIFGAASLGCAFSPTEPVLIACRVAQAVGSSLIMSTAPALLMQAAPPNRRGFALGFMSTSVYVGLAVGPPVGGELVRWLGWRSIFFAMVVVATIVFSVAVRVVPRTNHPSPSRALDPIGALLVGATIFFLLLPCARGSAWGWTHPATLALGATGLVLIPIAIGFEFKHPAPTLDPRLFRSAVFSSAAIAAALNYVTLFLATYLLPFALRDGQHMDASTVGRVVASQAAGMALFAFASGWLSDKLGPRGLAAGGMLVTGAGLLGFSLCWPTSGILVPMMWLFICGAGTGVFITPNSSALMGAAPRSQQGSAGGVMALARTFGMALGVAVASGLFATAFPSGTVVGMWPSGADDVVRTGLGIGALSALVASIVSFCGQSQRPVAPGTTSETRGDPDISQTMLRAR
jgi:EmrB/QacA subfamily drug resistance transporter